MSFVSNSVGVVLVDSRVNSGIINLPTTSSEEGRNIIFKDEFGKFSQNTLTLSTDVANTFEDGSTTNLINQTRGYANIIGTNNIWYQVGGSESSEQYISSLNISSINLSNYISENNLQSTTRGLGSLGYISTPNMTSLNLESTVKGLGSSEYLSSYSTIVFEENLQSTIVNINYVSSFVTYINPSENFCVGVGTGSAEILYSYDSINWSASSSTLFGTAGNCIAWNGSLWVAGGYSAGVSG